LLFDVAKLQVLLNLQFNCTEKCPDFAPYKEPFRKGNEMENVCVYEHSYHR